MALEPIRKGDDLEVTIPVVDENGNEISLLASTLDAVAYYRGLTVTPVVSTTINPESGNTSFAVLRFEGDGASALGVGEWTIQLRVTVGTDTQIVAEDTVKVLEGFI